MIKEQNDLNDKSPAIVCGKIFAVMESIQRAAQGKDLNAGIRERFFSFASTSPAPAFGRLMKLSQITFQIKARKTWTCGDTRQTVAGIMQSFERISCYILTRRTRTVCFGLLSPKATGL